MLATAAAQDRLKGLLSVTVLQATDLPKADWIGENDNFVEIDLLLAPKPTTDLHIKRTHTVAQDERSQRTQVQYGRNPVWNEKMAFSIPGTHKGPVSLQISVFDEDIHRSEFVAGGAFDLSTANLDKDWMEVKWIDLKDLKDRDGGKICVVCHYIPESMVGYFQKKYNAKAAEVKTKIIQGLVTRATGVATSQINSMVGL
ncbi:hypothetical protein HDU87_006089 [Geranomyces variabilis]|uniref:C2 domain-containing protein n=1 Tax=Geranomyces variabilis TaxID=109894 RepID=A0AAD5TGN1_9FUNG|nr:hypothetical protein HDU87_006089 [Geranomyces variabilis]